MGQLVDVWRMTWQWMLQPPWRHPNDGKRNGHWATWLLGWPWTVAGLVGGALVAPSLMQAVGLAHMPYTDKLELAVTVVAGLLVQIAGWVLLSLFFMAATHMMAPSGDNSAVSTWGSLLFLLTFTAIVLLPIAGVVYGVTRYFAWVGPNQRAVLINVAIGLLINSILLPGIGGGIIMRALNWVRGGKAKTSA